MAFLAAAAPVISAVAGTAGAAIGAIGAVRQGENQAAEARYQAQVQRNNQITAGQNAQYAIQAGEAQTTEVGLRERAKSGAITTGLAANNMDVNTGSAADVRKSQAELGQFAEETQRSEAQLAAYGYRTQATSFGAQSQLLRAEAPQDVTGGFLSGAGTLLAQSGNTFSKWGSLFPSSSAAGGGAVGGGLPLGA